ncbi:MAG: anthranilate phosphoribosyltransferase [Candidatus Zixiibacteriota bacterium]
MVKETLHKLAHGESLNFDDATAFIDAIADGMVAPTQVAAFLTGLRVKGESVVEVAACASALRKRAIAVPHHQSRVFDCCGTGGDNSHSFNISTAASLVVAASGVPVAKHGNRAMSSSCGSADILEAAGVKLELGPEDAARLLDELGYCFLFAPTYHPAMKNVAAVRKELGFRTIFNMLGPLLNPARATHQLIGTATRQTAELLASAAQHLPGTRIVTVHNSHGFDEILPTGTNHRYQWVDADLFSDQIELPLALQNGYQPADLRGGDRETNLAILLQVLGNKDSAYKVATLLNAGFALVIAGAASDLEHGTEIAAEAIRSGKAGKLLADYASASQGMN